MTDVEGRKEVSGKEQHEEEEDNVRTTTERLV